MQCLTHVLKSLVLATTLTMSAAALATDAVIVDNNYCESLALMAKAGAEAKSRGESKNDWITYLRSLKGYVVKNKDNVLYSILPKVVTEADTVYRNRETPMRTYATSYNNCMANDYGNVVAIVY